MQRCYIETTWKKQWEGLNAGCRHPKPTAHDPATKFRGLGLGLQWCARTVTAGLSKPYTLNSKPGGLRVWAAGFRAAALPAATASPTTASAEAPEWVVEIDSFRKFCHRGHVALKPFIGLAVGDDDYVMAGMTTPPNADDADDDHNNDDEADDDNDDDDDTMTTTMTMTTTTVARRAGTVKQYAHHHINVIIGIIINVVTIIIIIISIDTITTIIITISPSSSWSPHSPSSLPSPALDVHTDDHCGHPRPYHHQQRHDHHQHEPSIIIFNMADYIITITMIIMLLVAITLVLTAACTTSTTIIMKIIICFTPKTYDKTSSSPPMLIIITVMVIIITIYIVDQTHDPRQHRVYRNSTTTSIAPAIIDTFPLHNMASESHLPQSVRFLA